MIRAVTAQEQPPQLTDNDAPPEAAVNRDFKLTESGNAERLVRDHGADLRYVHAWGRWLVWDGTRYGADDRGEVSQRCKRTIRALGAAVENIRDDDARKNARKFVNKSESAAARKAMAVLAQSEPGIPIAAKELDSDPWLLNVENGTIDLRTGRLRDHDRADLITKLAPVTYDPAACAPVWDAFLLRVLPDAEVRAFVQRFAGYALTGTVVAHLLLFFYGTGRNGKTTLFKALLALLGEYGTTVPEETLLADPRGSRHPTEVAKLQGKRLAVASEIDQGRQFAEARLKSLTGGDPVEVRKMHEDFWTLEPTHKFVIVSNHKPIVRGDDDGIWSRIATVPFEERIPDAEIDPELSAKLAAERPGILNWALEGLRSYQSIDIKPPAAVQAASKAYRDEMDTIGNFLRDCCVIAKGRKCPVADLVRAYRHWCEQAGDHPMSGKALTRGLRKHGVESVGGTVRQYEGVTVRPEAEVPRDDSDRFGSDR